MGRRCRDNATTAVGKTSDGCPIEVSFTVADPPSLTRCVVDCPHFHLTSGGGCGSFENNRNPPRVTGADGAFILLLVTFPDHPHRYESTDLFVYNSGGSGAPPSLEVIPRPYPVGYQYNYVGVLSCGDGDHCLLIIPKQRPEGNLLSYDLHIFSTKTKSWSIKVVRLLDSDVTPHGCLFNFTRAFALGRGSVAWVDHRNGILLCDEVDGDDTKVRLIQLPPLMPVNANLEVDFDGIMPCLDRVRDVTFSRNDGCFRFIEVGFPQLDAGGIGELNFRWTAAMFNSSRGWSIQIHGRLAVSAELSPTDSCLPGLFPAIWDPEGKKLSLNNVISSFPTLDLYNEDIVYMLAEMKSTDDPPKQLGDCCQH